MKVLRVEYAICKNAEYVAEIYDKKKNEGGFTFTPCIANASSYPSAENAQKFVEDCMKLNINNVSIHRVTHHTPLITPLVLVNGVFVNLDTVEQCVTCNQWFPMNEIHKYRHDLNSDIESYCDEHYHEMCRKYPDNL